VAARTPRWKPATVDRYLVLASAAGVSPLVCLNKIDLAPPGEDEAALAVYERLEIPVVRVSAVTGEGVGDLVGNLTGRASVLMGPSGAGKSTLVNLLVPGAAVRVGEVSDRTTKGRHTTSWVELLDLPGGGHLIDSPGLRVLGLGGIPPEELDRHFPEIRERAGECRFQDCRHRAEPGCAVKEAVEAGAVAATRYDSYARIHDSLESGSG
jgi:ribosome biogenesis GTPase